MEKGAQSQDEELFERCCTRKKPGVAEIGLHEHAVRPHRYRVGDGAHGAQNMVMVDILAFFLGEKREEFFFGATLIQHRGFSQPRE
jgi:hypothetical protein